MSELKPCPFCGSTVIIDTSTPYNDGWRECKSCGSTSPIWNTRPTPNVERLVENLLLAHGELCTHLDAYGNEDTLSLRAVTETFNEAKQALLSAVKGGK